MRGREPSTRRQSCGARMFITEEGETENAQRQAHANFRLHPSARPCRPTHHWRAPRQGGGVKGGSTSSSTSDSRRAGGKRIPNRALAQRQRTGCCRAAPNNRTSTAIRSQQLGVETGAAPAAASSAALLRIDAMAVERMTLNMTGDDKRAAACCRSAIAKQPATATPPTARKARGKEGAQAEAATKVKPPPQPCCCA